MEATMTRDPDRGLLSIGLPRDQRIRLTTAGGETIYVRVRIGPDRGRPQVDINAPKSTRVDRIPEEVSREPV